MSRHVRAPTNSCTTVLSDELLAVHSPCLSCVLVLTGSEWDQNWSWWGGSGHCGHGGLLMSWFSNKEISSGVLEEPRSGL